MQAVDAELIESDQSHSTELIESDPHRSVQPAASHGFCRLGAVATRICITDSWLTHGRSCGL